MAVDAGIAETGILIALEFIHRVVHKRFIEYAERHEKLKISGIQTGDLFEIIRLQIGDNVDHGLLTVVGEIHEDRDTGSELDELFLDLFAEGLIFLFLVGDLFLLRRVLGGAFFSGLLDLFRLIDDGLNVLIQAAEALDLHEGCHSLLIGHKPGKRDVVHIDEKRALPAAGKQRGGGAGHGVIEDLRGADLAHGAAVVGNNGKEVDKFLHLFFGADFSVGIQPAAVVGDLLERPVEREVKYIALPLHDLAVDLPRALHAERRLKIGFRAFEIAQHEDPRPRLHGNAGRQLAAGERDGLALQRVGHGLLHRGKGGKPDACGSSGAHIDGVIVIKGVLPLREQILHCLAGRNARQKPDGVRKNVEKPRIGKRHGGAPRAEFQLVPRRFEIRAADEIEPFLHIILVDEPGVFALPLRFEEYVQIKLVELALLGDLADAVGNFVGHHDHAGERSIGILFADPVFLGALFVGVGPVIDLLLDEFAGIERAERRAGKIEIVPRGDGEPRFVAGVVVIKALALVHGVLVLAVEELFGAVLPCAEMILVKNDKVPVDGMYPLVVRFDAAELVQAEKILKGAEADDRAALIRAFVLLIDGRLGGILRPGDELPALKIHMREKVFLPRALHRGLEREDQHTGKAHFLCQLIRGERLAEAHFRVPEKPGDLRRRLPVGGAEICHRLRDGVRLLRAHGKIPCAVLAVLRPVFHRHPRGADIVRGAAEPFAVHAPDAVAHKIPVNVVVGKAAAVAVHGGLLENDLIGHAAGAERRVLLRHAPLHIALCVADLQQALIVGVVLLVGIDHRMSIRPPGEKLRVTHRRHRPTPSALSWTQ